MDKEALKALKRRRRHLLGYIENAERRLKAQGVQLEALNARIARWDNQFRPEVKPSPHLKYRPDRPRLGAMLKALVKAMRSAGGPVSVAAMVAAVPLSPGCKTPAPIRIRAALNYLVETGRAQQTGRYRQARWSLVLQNQR